MPGRRTWTRPVLTLMLLALVFAWAPLAPAQAEDLETAQTLLDGGAKAKARAALAAFLDGDAEADALELLQAAQIARALPDIELLRTIRAAAEGLEADATDADANLDLALGFAYLGLAEENLRLRTTSRSISLYFADALARATKIAATSEHGETAARLAAGVRFAQGDLKGALAGLAAHRDATEAVSPRFEALHGRLMYEAAAAMPVTSSGHATEEAQDLLKKAAAALGVASAAESLPGVQRRAAALRRAYAFHRLGDVDAGAAAYRDAFDEEPRQATLVVRGVQSLYARDGAAQMAALEALAKAHDDPLQVVDAILTTHRSAGAWAKALVAAERRLAKAPEDPMSWYYAGLCLNGLGIPARAQASFEQGLRLDPANLFCSWELEGMARRVLPKDADAAIAIYERLIALRPDDPYTRNNYGFILRDLVSAHTDKLQGGLERVKADAPEGTLARLKRCAGVYAEAVARIDPAKDGDHDEMTAWNLAGIINDYGLIIHYFLDVQQAELAEQQYMRALEMTDYGFKDTYSPNLHRLYRYVYTGSDHAWRWYSVAREAKDAILMEAQDEQGRLVLVPDERKRAAARRDMEITRARILQVLELDAGEHGLPWPPAKENGNDR